MKDTGLYPEGKGNSRGGSELGGAAFNAAAPQSGRRGPAYTVTRRGDAAVHQC